MSDAFLRALRFARRQRLFAPGDRVLVGLGGGRASLGLLGFLSSAAHDLALAEIAVASIESDDELSDAAEAVADVGRVARQLGLSFYAVRPNARGRVSVVHELRGLAAAQGFQKVALGHHRDDDARRVFFEVCTRGTDGELRGLAPKLKGHVVRPLLPLSGPEAMALGTSLGVELPAPPPPVARRGLEVRLEHAVLNRLRALVPNVDQTLAALGRNARIQRATLLRQAAERIDAGRLPDGSIELKPVARNAPLAGAIARVLLGADAFAPEARAHMRRLTRMLSHPDGATVLLAGALTAEHVRARGVVRMRPRGVVRPSKR